MRLVRVAVNVEQLLYRPPGGIGRYTVELVRLLPQLFPDIEVVPFTALHRGAHLETAWRGAIGAGTGAAGVPAGHPIRLPLPRAVLYEAWNTLGWPPLAWMARSGGAAGSGLAGVDLVHAPSVAVPPRGRQPLVVTVHDVAPALFPEAFPRHGRWFHTRGLAAAARRADMVITVSHAAADEIKAHSTIAPERLRIVPNGVDHAEASAGDIGAALAHHGLSGMPYILWVGTLEPRKNVATLVHAFAALVDSGRSTDHRLVLAGPSGWLSDNLVPASVLGRLGGAGGRVRLLGHVGEAELRALYAGATVFALPSRHEGFGLPVLEAMAQGTAVVCSDIAALRELTGATAAPNTGAARLVAPDDADAWAEALAALVNDDGARQRLAAAGRARAAEFSWERTVRATYDVYSGVLSGAG